VIDAPVLLAVYQAKVQQENNGYKWLRSSEFTAKKLKADRERDKVFRGLSAVLRALEKHFDPTVRNNAVHVFSIVSNFGDIPHAGYDAATADYNSILSKLAEDDYRPAVQALQLTPWLTELERLNTLFKSYVEDTLEEALQKPDITFRAARLETDAALRKLAARITALIEINGGTNYLPLVEEFNEHVSHYNLTLHEHLGRLHAKTDIAGSIVETIGVQAYTGKPVNVIPTVSVRKVEKDGSHTLVELVFTVDFMVKYRNNVAPGTATIIVYGIGKYAGEIIGTFNIEA
jgi:hypothetical protein